MLFTALFYLDPGSGSFIIQIAIASLLGLGIALRASWGKLRKLFGRKAETKPEDDDSTDA